MDARADYYYSYQGRVNVTDFYYNNKPKFESRTLWTARLFDQMRTLFRNIDAKRSGS